LFLRTRAIARRRAGSPSRRRGGTREGESEYDQLLAGQPVRDTLRRLEGLFALALQEVALGTSSPVYKNAHPSMR
jgi:hypothetical protein